MNSYRDFSHADNGIRISIAHFSWSPPSHCFISANLACKWSGVPQFRVYVRIFLYLSSSCQLMAFFSRKFQYTTRVRKYRVSLSDINRYYDISHTYSHMEAHTVSVKNQSTHFPAYSYRFPYFPGKPLVETSDRRQTCMELR